MLKLWLPLCPSLNSLYPGKAKRHKSKAYEAWIKEAGQILLTQKPWHFFDEPVQVTYRVGKPSKRNMDLCNREKALSDLLVGHGILKDDSLIHRLVMEWAEITGVEAIIEPLRTEAN